MYAAGRSGSAEEAQFVPKYKFGDSDSIADVDFRISGGMGVCGGDCSVHVYDRKRVGGL